MTADKQEWLVSVDAVATVEAETKAEACKKVEGERRVCDVERAVHAVPRDLDEEEIHAD